MKEQTENKTANRGICVPFVIKLSPSNKFGSKKSRCDNFLTIDFEKNTDNRKLCAFSALASSAFSSKPLKMKSKQRIKCQQVAESEDCIKSVISTKILWLRNMC